MHAREIRLTRTGNRSNMLSKIMVTGKFSFQLCNYWMIFSSTRDSNGKKGIAKQGCGPTCIRMFRLSICHQSNDIVTIPTIENSDSFTPASHLANERPGAPQLGSCHLALGAVGRSKGSSHCCNSSLNGHGGCTVGPVSNKYRSIYICVCLCMYVIIYVGR